MSIIRYDNGETRDTETMCHHCRGNCICKPRKVYVNAKPGCGAGNCNCMPPDEDAE